jgi:hypothetical protein
VAERVAWVRAAAGARFDALELHINCGGNVIITDDPVRAAQSVADRLAHLPPNAPYVVNADPSAEELLESPHVLIGSVDQIADTLRERRGRYGISCVSVGAPSLDAFAPVVARLAGT